MHAHALTHGYTAVTVGSNSSECPLFPSKGNKEHYKTDTCRKLACPMVHVYFSTHARTHTEVTVGSRSSDCSLLAVGSSDFSLLAVASSDFSLQAVASSDCWQWDFNCKQSLLVVKFTTASSEQWQQWLPTANFTTMTQNYLNSLNMMGFALNNIVAVWIWKTASVLTANDRYRWPHITHRGIQTEISNSEKGEWGWISNIGYFAFPWLKRKYRMREFLLWVVKPKMKAEVFKSQEIYFYD